MANTKHGRALLNLEDAPIEKLLMNSVHYRDEGKITAVFHSRHVFGNLIRRRWKDFTAYAQHLLNENPHDLSSLVLYARSCMATVGTFFPDATPSTTFDGYIDWAPNQGWSFVRDETATSGGTDNINITDTVVEVRARKAVGVNNYSIGRGWILFDTTSIPASATVTAAANKFSFIASVSPTNTDGTGLEAFSSNPASNTQLVGEDWDTIGTTQYADLSSITGVSTSVYTDMPMTTAGDSAIQTAVTGGTIVKLGFRLKRDTQDSAPTGENILQMEAAETADTTSDPKLTVTYTSASTPAARKTVILL